MSKVKQTQIHYRFVLTRFNRKERRFSYLMEEYGRLRVREYNTLHRAIRKSSWGPVRCSIALHLRVKTVMGYSSTNMNRMNILALPTKNI